MDYGQARDFIKETGKYGSVYGLDSICGLMARLGDVHEQLSMIHVAGTKGKGSVCTMLAGVLQAAGYRTGVYLSPAVFAPEESFQVGGGLIPQETFAQLAEKVQAACSAMTEEGLPHPTAFEVETAIAFCFFKQEGCDLVVLETGLGGTTDATNLITRPVCSVITSISKDHMALLGNTLEEIAAAKAGIIKPGCPCVSAQQEPQVKKVLEQTAAAQNSELRFADDSHICSFLYKEENSEYATKKLHGTLALSGAFQKENLACVLETLALLQERGIVVTDEAIQDGLAKAWLPGRFEKISSAPDVYLDGAHNEGAALRLRETIQGCFAGRRVVYVIGIFADKEYEKLLAATLAEAAQVFTVTPDHPRALDGRKLAQLAQKYHPAVTYVPDLAQAAVLAQEAAGQEGVVLAFGSFSFLPQFKRAVLENTKNAGQTAGRSIEI